jgi:NTE family protein
MIRPKVGLALSGGGARGLVHVGVIKVLLEAGIPIDCISGTSMGGVIAAAFACQIPIQTIEEKVLKLAQMRELVRLVDLSPKRRGLLEGNRVRDYLAELFLDRSFENLAIPLAIPAVDLIQSREVVFKKGLLLPAVLATIAVPGLFRPVEIGGCRLVDGGILNNLPVDLARALGADVVIAIDAQLDPFHEKPWQDASEPVHFPVPAPDFFLDFYRAELIMIARLTEERLKACPPDILLHPPIPMDIEMFLGFRRVREVIAVGEACARAALTDIQKILGDWDIQAGSQAAGDQ